METIRNWPMTCEYVCGIMVFNENFDVPVSNMKAILKSMKFLNGGIRVMNSPLKDLSFLPEFGTTCDDNGAFILNNSKLENVDFILKNYQFMNPFDNCIFQISNNPKLNTKSICNNFDFMNRIGINQNFEISDNKVDCGCQGTLTFDNLEKFKNCKEVVGKLIITDNRDIVPVLSKLKLISGDLEVAYTTLKNLSFLENLTELKAFINLSNHRILINIHDNKEMIRLGIKSLKTFTNLNFEGHLNMNFENLHPDFCLSVDEMIMLLNIDAKFIKIEASFCQNVIRKSDKPKVCKFENMANLETDCVIIYGDLLIDSGDEQYTDKLKKVIYIFGTLIIQNTDLEHVKFLKTLIRVVSLDGGPVMKFESNSKLRSIDFPKLQGFVVRSPSDNRAIISGNHENLFTKVKDCLMFQFLAQTNVSFNGKACKSIPSNLIGERIEYTYNDTKKISYKFDFDTDMDYSEEGRDSWYSLYDGDLELSDEMNLLIYEVTWYGRGVNDVAAVMGFVINNLHLIVLLQKELRTNFIYILMIGISICDVLFASTFITEYLLSNGWIYEIDQCVRPKFHILISRLESPIQEATRKSSTFLAFFMALFRTCSVMFPTSNVLVTVSKPRWAVLLVLVVFSVQGSFDAATFWLCRKTFKLDENSYTCHELYNTLEGYYGQCVRYVNEEGENYTLKMLMQIDGHFTIVLAVCYSIVTIALLTQLRAARNRRKSLKSEKSESNTSMLVTFMAITFFLSELTYGLFFISQSYIQLRFEGLAERLSESQVILWSLVSFNSTAHCLICFFLSSQYRGAMLKVFWRKREVKSVVVDLQSISGAKGSTGRTY